MRFIHLKPVDSSEATKAYNTLGVLSLEQNENFTLIKFSNGKSYSVSETEGEVFKLINSEQTIIELNLVDNSVEVEFDFI